MTTIQNATAAPTPEMKALAEDLEKQIVAILPKSSAVPERAPALMAICRVLTDLLVDSAQVKGKGGGSVRIALHAIEGVNLITQQLACMVEQRLQARFDAEYEARDATKQ